jgi:hypothetical protein
MKTIYQFLDGLHDWFVLVTVAEEGGVISTLMAGDRDFVRLYFFGGYN